MWHITGVQSNYSNDAKGDAMKKIRAWYFSDADCKLRFGDGRLIVPGETHTVDHKPVLCEAGLHGSVKPLDALQYAPGSWVWRVELSGAMDIGDDKLAATERKYLWGYDATDVLRAFARKCALDVANLWDAPDVVVRYLKTGDESIRSAAKYAAESAAEGKQNKRLQKMLMDGRPTAGKGML